MFTNFILSLIAFFHASWIESKSGIDVHAAMVNSTSVKEEARKQRNVTDETYESLVEWCEDNWNICEGNNTALQPSEVREQLASIYQEAVNVGNLDSISVDEPNRVIKFRIYGNSITKSF